CPRVVAGRRPGLPSRGGHRGQTRLGRRQAEGGGTRWVCGGRRPRRDGGPRHHGHATPQTKGRGAPPRSPHPADAQGGPAQRGRSDPQLGGCSGRGRRGDRRARGLHLYGDARAGAASRTCPGELDGWRGRPRDGTGRRGDEPRVTAGETTKGASGTRGPPPPAPPLQTPPRAPPATPPPPPPTHP